MGSLRDGQLGFKVESTFKTGVVVDTFPEVNSEDLDADLTYVDGAGFVVGSRTEYGDRSVLVSTKVGGSFETDLYSKGLGKLIQAALGGTGTSTNIAGASYQQLFTPTTGGVLSSYTIQVGVPVQDGGTVLPKTFVGMVCTGFELTGAKEDVGKIKFNWIGADLVTGTALATASYASSVVPLSFVGATIGLGGTLTVPTTTALGTGATATTNVTDINLTYENKLDENGRNFGGAGKLSRKPQYGGFTAEGTLTVEYTDNTLRDLWLANTSLPLTLTYAAPVAISGANYPTFQISIPAIKLRGKLPAIETPGEVISVEVPFKVKDDRVATHPFYVAIVTAETAI